MDNQTRKPNWHRRLKMATQIGVSSLMLIVAFSLTLLIYHDISTVVNEFVFHFLRVYFAVMLVVILAIVICDLIDRLRLRQR